MGIHFISVLGTGLYEPVIYNFPGKKGTKPQEFVQIALMSEFKEKILNGGKASILLTDGARAKNWEDREYTGIDEKLSERWVSDKKQEIKQGAAKAGMKSILQKEEPELLEKLEPITIVNPVREEEIWSVFETIYQLAEEGEEIVFDITHSFRSIPMLAVAALNYVKVLKNCTIKGIYYGAYEDRNETKPIIDLTVYNEIMEWTNAAEAFIRYGIASKMQEVYAAKMEKIRTENTLEVFKERKKQWAPVQKKINAMQNLAACISTSRGTDAKKISVNKPHEKSIKNAYEYLIDSGTDEETEEKAREIKPLYPLMEKIDDVYKKYFGKEENEDKEENENEENYKIGCRVVEWNIQNHMIQQGYTALEETIKTYLCYRYGIESRTEYMRDRLVGKIMTGINVYMKNERKSKKDFEKEREQNPDEVCKYIRKNMSTDIVEEFSGQINRIILTVPLTLALLCVNVKDTRNDISHFGFRKTPMTAGHLAELLEKYYQDFSAFIAADTIPANS